MKQKRGFGIIPLVVILLILLGIGGALLLTLRFSKKMIPKEPTTTAVQSELGVSEGNATTIHRSLGLFYPYSQGKTINNAHPTIIGKLLQNSQPYLTTQFGQEISPVSGEQKYFLRFIPGRVKNLTIRLDDQIIKAVYGFAQYPTVLCEKQTTNPNGSNGEPLVFTSEKDCFRGKKDDIPPLIFIFKPQTPLVKGLHTITISDETINYPTLMFTVDPDFSLPPQQVPLVGSIYQEPNPFQTTDNCGSGYYFDANHLRVPMVKLANDNLLYQLSFPQIKDDKATNRKRVYLAFDNELFDFFFPSGKTFFGNNDEWMNGNKGLYLPEDHLFFANWTVARPPQFGAYSSNPTGGKLISPNYNSYDTSYYEIQPVDFSGREYLKNSLPWIITGSSSCDG